MVRFASRKSVLVGLGLLAVALLVAFWQPWQARDVQSTGLVDLKDVDTLQTQFNDDAGKARLILIVSPT